MVGPRPHLRPHALTTFNPYLLHPQAHMPCHGVALPAMPCHAMQWGGVRPPPSLLSILCAPPCPSHVHTPPLTAVPLPRAPPCPSHMHTPPLTPVPLPRAPLCPSHVHTRWLRVTPWRAPRSAGRTRRPHGTWWQRCCSCGTPEVRGGGGGGRETSY